LPLPQNMTGDGKSQGSKNGTQSKVISLPVWIFFLSATIDACLLNSFPFR
jgi:hypothetical protein